MELSANERITSHNLINRRAEVKPIIAARPFTRSATARKSLGRSIDLSIRENLIEVDEAFLDNLLSNNKWVVSGLAQNDRTHFFIYILSQSFKPNPFHFLRILFRTYNCTAKSNGCIYTVRYVHTKFSVLVYYPEETVAVTGPL